MRAADWPATLLHPESSEPVTEVVKNGIKKWTITKGRNAEFRGSRTSRFSLYLHSLRVFRDFVGLRDNKYNMTNVTKFQ